MTKENTILINKIKKYIEQNVSQKLSLEELAKQANYSPFHFQRIFKSVANETPKQYIKRLRLEKSAHFITLKPNSTILEVAFEYGFSSLEVFSRAFKNYYKISPDGFRKSSEDQKVAIIQAKTDKTLAIDLFLPKVMANASKEIAVEIVKLSPRKAFYISITLLNTEIVTNSFKKVKQWAEVRSLAKPKAQLFGLLLDYPLFTSLDKCRFYTCIETDSQQPESGEVSYIEIPSKTYVSFKVKGGIAALIELITKINTHWLPESGYEFDHSPAVLIPLDDPLSTHQHEIVYQIFIAIKPK